MKKTFISLSLALGVVASVFAIDASFTLPTGVANTTNLINGGLLVSKIELINGGEAAVAFRFIDSWQTNSSIQPRGTANGYTLTTWSNGSYQVTISYATNFTKIITNFNGVTQHQAYSGYYTVTNTVISRTNNFPILTSGTLATGAGSLLVLELGDGIVFSRGLTLTNTVLATGLVVNVTYSPLK